MAEKEVTLNQIAVMIEKVGSDVKAVAEGHEVIRSEMRQMKDEIIEKISFVDGKVEHLGREVREIKEKANKIDKTLDEHVKLPAHAA
jgi:archaellum component FlaC